MNRFQRFILSAASAVVPQLREAVRSAGSAQRAIEQMAAAGTVLDGYSRVHAEMTLEIQECNAIAGSGPRSSNLRESAQGRYLELELQLDNVEWQRQQHWASLEFSRYGIQQLILIARLYFLKNPLVKRGIKIASFYVFGRGFEIRAEDDPAANDLVQSFLDANREELGMLGLTEKDQSLRTDGGLFFVFFTALATGDVKIRTIDPVEIMDIITNPEDAAQPWFYRRSWVQETFDDATGARAVRRTDAWYPAIDHEPAAKLDAIEGKPILWDTPVYHVKVGGLVKWKFGLPECYATLDWAKAYKKFLENWSSITEALARFAFVAETKGGPQGIQALQNVLATTTGGAGGSAALTAFDSNPPPVAASALVTGPGNKLSPVRTAGATTEPEQGRRVMLMVAASDGLPETFYGDASTGSLATARSLDRPTELQFLHRQELWREILQRIITFALARSVGAAKGKLREAYQTRAPRFVWLRKNRATGAWIKEAKAEGVVTLKVDFPSVLEHDITESINAIVAAGTLNGYAPAGTIDIKTLAGLLLREMPGITDIDQLLEDMFPDADYDPVQDILPAEPDPSQAPALMAEVTRRILEAARRQAAAKIAAAAS